MANNKYKTIGELIFYAYSNLAMAHAAVSKQQKKYGVVHYMIRSKMYKGLTSGTMNIRTIFDDEKIKVSIGNKCNYCGCANNLALDHILPKKLGGIDSAENLIFACRSCNSSKGAKDLMEWMETRDSFLPLLIIRRYLKLVFQYCEANRLLEVDIDQIESLNIPFRLDLIPKSYPAPIGLKEYA